MIPVLDEQLIKEHLKLLPVQNCKQISLWQAPLVFDFWEAWEAKVGCECEIPYWAIIWPAGRVMATYILNHPELVAKKTVLDFGSGSGVTGIAAARAKAASVIVNDIDPVALDMAQKNSLLNNVSITTEQRDLTALSEYCGAEIIIVAEMFYLQSHSPVILSYIQNARRQGIEVYIADGSRTYTPRTDITLIHEEVVSVDKEVEGKAERTVRILKLN